MALHPGSEQAIGKQCAGLDRLRGNGELEVLFTQHGGDEQRRKC